MKKVILFSALGLSLLVASCSETASTETKTEEVAMVSYGPGKIDADKAITVADLLKEMEGKSGDNEFTFEGEINEVCSKAGCWINVKKGDGSTFMVRFKDHFTIPTNTKVGTMAILHGNAYWDTIPVDMLQHFAEDAGKSKEEIAKIMEPSFELAFEADAISFAKPEEAAKK